MHNATWNEKYSDIDPGAKIRMVAVRNVELLIETDNEYVIYTVFKMTSKAGFKMMDQAMTATAASELATNILRYAKKGSMAVMVIEDEESGRMGIEILAQDEGPGIENMDLAMKEHYSTLPSSLGFGLCSVKRIVDEFYIESEVGKGTRILVRKWKSKEAVYPDE